MENKIIQPAHNKSAMICKSWRYIKYEAESLRKFIKEAKFIGEYKSAYAISHAQVSYAPLHFFVINETILDGRLKKWFGHWCVINIKILEGDDPVLFPEACMSFPYRQPKKTKRWNRIKVEYYIPFFWTWRRVRRRLRGLPAFIVAHELEHAIGQNIYGKF